MGKASSAKKIKRVQQAGVNRRPGQRRALGFPVAIAAIVVLGVAFVWLARGVKVDSDNASPRPNLDHWHMPFGVYVCNAFSTAKISDVGGDKVGIHTHDDGPLYIHVHPFGDGGSGKNATMDKFVEQVGMKLSDNSFTMPDGTTYTNGDECTLDAEGTQKEPGVVAMLEWPPQASSAMNDDGTPQTEPKIIREGLSDIRFDEDGKSYVLAFVPESRLNKVPPPPSLAELAKGNIPDLNTTPTPSPDGGTPTSSAPATSQAPATSAPATSAPADGSAPTSAAPSTTAAG